MKKEKSCGAVIIHDGKVLLEHQTNGSWSFPKGHVERGESEKQTAIREVKEETGLDIAINESVRFVFSYIIDRDDIGNKSGEKIDKKVILFLASLKDSNQKLLPQEAEISELRWVPFAEVSTIFDREAWKKAWNFFQTFLR